MNALNFGLPAYKTSLIALLTLVYGLLSAQTPLSNGINQAGTLAVNTTNSYTLSAKAGDSVVLRLGTTGFDGALQIFGPAGNFLKSAASEDDAELDYTPTNSGTFSVLVMSYYTGQAGTYVLHLAQFPEPFSVSPGEAGGAMTNGGSFTGTNNLGDLNLWSFTANPGDSLVLRLGTTGYDGNLSLYGPSGNVLKTAASDDDAEIDVVATNSGTFTALVDSYYTGQTGTYALHLAQFPEPFIVPPGAQGGPMTNGGRFLGTNGLGDLSLWSLTAKTGDNITVRLGTTNFQGDLSLYGPNGNLLMTAASLDDAQITYTATNSGTFAALVDSYYSGGVGTYALYLAQFPEPFTVPAGEQGGMLVNGGNNPGTIALGELNLWSFNANMGDSVVLRLGATNFDGDLSLYGPNGNLLKTSASVNDTEIDFTPTNSGTFTALVDSYYTDGTGTYVLYLIHFPEPFIIPPGNQGGKLSGANQQGTITLGELDPWVFTACTGDAIRIELMPTNFTANLAIYGTAGNLLASTTASSINTTATNCGNFYILIDSYYPAGTGSYGLTVNHLAFQTRLCVPEFIQNTNLLLTGVGGITNAGYTLYSTTNLTGPVIGWTPVVTNTFDQYGVLSYTNSYSTELPKEAFFRFAVITN
ncbi:MAG: hypothetical protein ABSH48_23065 [Verrucomicrobiota bacterium]